MASNPAAKKASSTSEVRAAIEVLKKEHGWTNAALIGILKGGGTSSKGSEFEREFCERLSMWWAKRDDVFWRSSNSGGRATTRRDAGMQTAGQFGDVAATDPAGHPLLRALTIELKRGYNEHGIHDILDAPQNSAVQVYEGFFDQTMKAAKHAGSLSWLLVTRRDRREAICWFPETVRTWFPPMKEAPCPRLVVTLEVRSTDGSSSPVYVYGLLLSDFLKHLRPTHIHDALKRSEV